MRPIHERMPVISERGQLVTWLDSDLPEADALDLLCPYPEDAMTAYPVSQAVNSSKNQSSNLIEPQSS